jgi:hypothetical protein
VELVEKFWNGEAETYIFAPSNKQKMNIFEYPTNQTTFKGFEFNFDVTVEGVVYMEVAMSAQQAADKIESLKGLKPSDVKQVSRYPFISPITTK